MAKRQYNAIQCQNPLNVFDQDQKQYMENVYYTALHKVAKRLDFLLGFCIQKNREKNLIVWPRLNAIHCAKLIGHGLIVTTSLDSGRENANEAEKEYDKRGKI